MPTRPAYFHEILEVLTQAPEWRGVFAEISGVGAIALAPPVPLPDLDGTAETLDVTPRAVEAIRGWFARRGLDTDARDVKNAVDACAYQAGDLPCRYLPPALRAWWNELAGVAS